MTATGNRNASNTIDKKNSFLFMYSIFLNTVTQSQM